MDLTSDKMELDIADDALSVIEEHESEELAPDAEEQIQKQNHLRRFLKDVAASGVASSNDSTECASELEEKPTVSLNLEYELTRLGYSTEDVANIVDLTTSTSNLEDWVLEHFGKEGGVELRVIEEETKEATEDVKVLHTIQRNKDFWFELDTLLHANSPESLTLHGTVVCHL